MASISGIVFYAPISLRLANAPIGCWDADSLELFPFTTTDANGNYRFDNLPVGRKYSIVLSSVVDGNYTFEDQVIQVQVTQEIEYSNQNISVERILPTDYVLQVSGTVSPAPVQVNGQLVGYTGIFKKGYPPNTTLTVSVSHPSFDRFFVKWHAPDYPTVDGKITPAVTFTINKSGELLAIWEPIRRVTFQSNKPVTANYSYISMRTGQPITGMLSIGQYIDMFEDETTSLSITTPATAPDTIPFTQWEDGNTNPARTFPAGITTDLTVTATYGVVVTYILTISSTVGGTTFPIPGNYDYTEGTVETVTALPDPGYLLDHWELDGANIGATNPTTVTMTVNHELHAVFRTIPTGQGSLEVHAYEDSAEIGASVEVTGAGMFTTPFTRLLDVGNYTLTATYKTYPAQTRTASIVEGQTTKVDFSFVKPPPVRPQYVGPLGIWEFPLLNLMLDLLEKLRTPRRSS